jgi:SAM-dependent methyltransferase
VRGVTTTLADQQRDMWNAAAAGWIRADEHIERSLGPVARWLCDAVALAPGMRVLDIACGPGEPAMTAAARVAAGGGTVTAIDIAPDMVAATQRRAADLGLPVTAQVMDVEHLAFDDAAFDAATCRFGLMFCGSPAHAVASIRAVLKRGARFATSAWDGPERSPFFRELRAAVARFVPVPAPAPEGPGPFRFAAPGALARVLTGGGFADVHVEELPVAFRFHTPEEYWDLQSQMSNTLRTAIPQLAPAAVDELRATLLALARSYTTDGEVQFPATALVAVAR